MYGVNLPDFTHEISPETLMIAAGAEKVPLKHISQAVNLR
jgi:predicted SpoU family rRNA methylase